MTHASKDDLSTLGEGTLVYIRKISTKERKKHFPNVRGIPASTPMFCVFNANGDARALTDSWDAAVVYARENELQVSACN